MGAVPEAEPVAGEPVAEELLGGEPVVGEALGGEASGGEPVAGVDVAEAAKGFDLVVLDGHRRVVASAGRLGVADVVAEVARTGATLVCIDGPPAWAVPGRSRRAERDLRRLGHPCFVTPPDPGDHPFYRWMRSGFALWEALAPTHPRWAGGPLRDCAVEVFPAASATRLAGRRPAAGEGKVAHRRAVLRAAGVAADLLPTGDRVDAALAALTGLLGLEGLATVLGDTDDGYLLVPASHLSVPATHLSVPATHPSLPATHPCP